MSTSTAARLSLLALVTAASTGCLSSVSVRGSASAPVDGSHRVHARAKVDGDAVASLIGLLGAAATAEDTAPAAVASRSERARVDARTEARGERTRVETRTEARVEAGAVRTAASEGVTGELYEERGAWYASTRKSTGVAPMGDGGSRVSDRGGSLPDWADGEWHVVEEQGAVEGRGAVALASTGTLPAGSGSGSWRRGRGTVARAHRLADLVGSGVVVDGVRVSLSSLRPLAPATARTPAARADRRLTTGGAVEATVELDRNVLPADGGATRLVVRLRGDAERSAPRGRLRVHLVLDRSASMEPTWREALEAAGMLVGRLHPDDLLQVVSYGSRAEEVFALGPVGDGSRALESLAALRVGGFTNIQAGLELAYTAAARTPSRDGDSTLVILVSDGVPNVGAFGAGELGRLAAEARTSLGCTTTVVGLGADFDEAVLSTLSRQGRGGYHVAATTADLAPALLEELGSRQRVAARDVRLAVRVAEGVELGTLLDGNAGVELSGNDLSLSLPLLHADEERRIVVDLRVPAGTGSRALASVGLRFRDAASGRARRGERELAVRLGGTPGEGPVPAAVIDASLATALEAAARALTLNDSRGAAAALEEHCQAAGAHLAGPNGEELRARVDTVGRIAAALAFYGPGASDEDRRLTSRALGGLAIRLGR